MPSNHRRKSKKEFYWREQVAKWRASGLSQAEFSRQAGVSIKSLGYWKRRFDHELPEDRKPSPTIVPVPMAPSTQQPIPCRPIIIHVGRAFKLEIAGDFQPLVLEKVLRTLEHLA